jgi:hypothetical protein
LVTNAEDKRQNVSKRAADYRKKIVILKTLWDTIDKLGSSSSISETSSGSSKDKAKPTLEEID